MAELTAESITCYPLDMPRLSKDFNEAYHKKHPNDQNTYNSRQHLAIILAPRMAIIDEEFIGSDIDTDEIELSFWAEWNGIGEDGKNHHTFSMYPSFSNKFSLDTLKEYRLTETSLAEFTKDRRGYNSRIRTNEHLWMKHFNTIKAEGKA